jgi:site-specific recombinase XerD
MPLASPDILSKTSISPAFRLLATIFSSAGDNLKVVQELLGHSSAAFTLQVYGHVVPGLQEESTRALEARLLGSPRLGES